MLRTAQSLPLQGLLTLGFDAGRFPPTPPACYRASWQLPGPDSHRQATTSFTTTDHLFTMTSHLLVARKIWANVNIVQLVREYLEGGWVLGLGPVCVTGAFDLPFRHLAFDHSRGGPGPAGRKESGEKSS